MQCQCGAEDLINIIITQKGFHHGWTIIGKQTTDQTSKKPYDVLNFLINLITCSFSPDIIKNPVTNAIDINAICYSTWICQCEYQSYIQIYSFIHMYHYYLWLLCINSLVQDCGIPNVLQHFTAVLC